MRSGISSMLNNRKTCRCLCWSLRNAMKFGRRPAGLRIGMD